MTKKATKPLGLNAFGSICGLCDATGSARASETGCCVLVTCKASAFLPLAQGSESGALETVSKMSAEPYGIGRAVGSCCDSQS